MTHQNTTGLRLRKEGIWYEAAGADCGLADSGAVTRPDFLGRTIALA